MWPREPKFGSLYRGFRYNGARYIKVLTLFRLGFLGVPGPWGGGGGGDIMTSFFQKSVVFLVFSSYCCAEGQHSQKLMIKNT